MAGIQVDYSPAEVEGNQAEGSQAEGSPVGHDSPIAVGIQVVAEDNRQIRPVGVEDNRPGDRRSFADLDLQFYEVLRESIHKIRV